MSTQNPDEITQMILLLKYMITLKNIKNSKLKMKDLNIELENLQIELNHITQILTENKLNNGQKISLDESNNIIISHS